jgi:hypothetical protein
MYNVLTNLQSFTPRFSYEITSWRIAGRNVSEEVLPLWALSAPYAHHARLQVGVGFFKPRLKAAVDF